MTYSIRCLLVAACLLALTGCTRMARVPTLASNSGGSDSGGSNSDSGNSDSGNSSNSGNSSDSGGSGDSNSNSGSGGGDDGGVSTTVTVAVAVGIVGLVYLISLSSGPQTGPAGLDSAQREEAVRDASRWLAEHRRQVRVDIARGAGPFVDELALAHRLPIALRPTLGAALQRAHGSLDAPLAAGAPSADATVDFAEALGQAMRTEPALAAHLEAAVARHAPAR